MMGIAPGHYEGTQVNWF